MHSKERPWNTVVVRKNNIEVVMYFVLFFFDGFMSIKKNNEMKTVKHHNRRKW